MDVHLLLGGDVDRDWDRFPERDAILVGTQDMLLSRALDRGYATSRFRWPLAFGLLNNDCLWVMDEIQLMGAGLATTTQLQAFRRKLGTTAPVHSLWMSATMRESWLDTVDVDLEQDAVGHLCLDDIDRQHDSVSRRLRAPRPFTSDPIQASRDGTTEADPILELHRDGTLSLVVVNTVSRATSIALAVRRKKPDADVILLHSRFRPQDRKAILGKLLEPPVGAGTIAITTQVIEAGVDLSATTLITDLAPWPSMVQRFGRCNRRGDLSDASIHWIDADRSKRGWELPYEAAALERAAEIVRSLTDAAPASLPPIQEPINRTHVLRRRDLIDLFDTTPDLSGSDIDISRFIREATQRDVQVFWRDIPAEGPPADAPQSSRDELCSVPIHELGQRAAWRWDHLERRWARAPRPEERVPGMVFMLRASEGGYDPVSGWSQKGRSAVPIVPPTTATEEAADDDSRALLPWQSLVEHTDQVVAAVLLLLEEVMDLPEEHRAALVTAARWHDAGKAHAIFQGGLLGGSGEPPLNNGVWAKAPASSLHYSRRGFRHELASALAMLQLGLPDLPTYLAAAHHGKVRLSIRSMPNERPPSDPGLRFARGIHDGDVLAETDLGQGTIMAEMVLDLSPMEVGRGSHGPSWIARVTAMRDSHDLGPFRLAYLEALLRVADWRASAEQQGEEGLGHV